MRRGWLVLLGCAALAGCGGPAAPSAPVYDRAAPDHIDGRYRGIARLSRANIAGCPRSGPRVVTVEGNALSLTYRGPRASYSLAATVGPDGSIHGSDGRGTIEGQISGKHMDLVVSSEYCEVRYALEHL